MRFLACLLAAGLAGCATDPWTDPAGLHHDGETMATTEGREIRLVIKPLAEIQQDFAGTIAENKDRWAYAINFPQWCVITAPPSRFPQDAEWAAILWHELRHCFEGGYHPKRAPPPP